MKFSLIIDESTDIASKKQLAIVVRFYCDREMRVKSRFFKLVEVTKGDADTLANSVFTQLEKNGIPCENMIGFASDTTNVMFGAHHSVVTLLKEKIPNLFVMRCLCHSAHLCASHACERLPRTVEDLVRDIYSFFSHSAKRLAEFERFQHFAQTEPHKILKPAQTRWLSLQMCVARILEQWSALELFFVNAAQRDRLVAAENVSNALKSPIFKMYFQFLDYVLPKFTSFNKLFQSERPNIHCLTQELVSLYKSLLSCYLTNAYIKSQPLARLDPTSKDHMLPLTNMYMGHSVANSLAKPEILTMREDVRGFLEHCQLFYIEAALQVKQRFPIVDPVISSLSVLDPDALSTTQCSTILDVASKFPNVIAPSDLQKLDDEWRVLSFTDLPFKSDSNTPIDRFWGEVAALKDGSGDVKFPSVF